MQIIRDVRAVGDQGQWQAGQSGNTEASPQAETLIQFGENATIQPRWLEVFVVLLKAPRLTCQRQHQKLTNFTTSLFKHRQL